MSELVCFGCKQEFDLVAKEPLVLPSCGHTVCRSCLSEWVGETPGKVRCPEDEKEFSFEAGDGLGAFPKNISLTRLLSEKTRTEEANAAPVSPPQNQPATPSPVPSPASPVSPVVPEPEVVEERICVTHKKTADLVCITDQKIICADCVLFGEHKSHDYKRCMEFLRESEGKLDVIVAELESVKQSPMISGAEKKLSELRDKIKARQDELNSKLAAHFEQLHAKLRDIERSVQSELSSKIKSGGSRILAFEGQLRKLSDREFQISNRLSSLREQVQKPSPDFGQLISGLFGPADPLNQIGELIAQTRALEHEFSEVSISHINAVALSSNLPQALLNFDKACAIEVVKSRTASPISADRRSSQFMAKKPSLVADLSPVMKRRVEENLVDTNDAEEVEEFLDDNEFDSLADRPNFEPGFPQGKSKPLVRALAGSELLYAKPDGFSNLLYHPQDKRVSANYPQSKNIEGAFNKPLLVNMPSKREFLNESGDDYRPSKAHMNYSLGQAFANKDFGAQSYAAQLPPRPPVPRVNLASSRVVPSESTSILKSLKSDDKPPAKDDELVNLSNMHMTDAKLSTSLNELTRNKRLKKLLLDNNKITETGFDTLLKKLGTHETLERVSLIGNALDDNIFSKLEEAAPKLKTLRTFILTGNKAIKMTAKAKKSVASLKKLGFVFEI